MYQSRKSALESIVHAKMEKPKTKSCDHLWAVKDKVGASPHYKFHAGTRNYHQIGWNLPYIIYFCQKCLETKKVEEKDK